MFEFYATELRMDSGAIRLKQLRESAPVKLSVRRAAKGAGMPPGSYAAYEDAKRFKKRFIPVELAHSLVGVFGEHGIAREAVLALAGVGPDAPVIEAPAPPPVQFVTMQVALPSEAALARMFEGLLRPVDYQNQSVAELAQILARRLPTGLAQLQDLMPAPALAASPERGADLPALATDRPASRR
ncbi:XRE family transcriptional regulator [Sphingomonas sp.]|uniref:XRE family transcriptional regulator n=1 Tax=Sphingomonas sp. TaxID=28214 RepID=UPI002EDA40F2